MIICDYETKNTFGFFCFRPNSPKSRLHIQTDHPTVELGNNINTNFHSTAMKSV